MTSRRLLPYLFTIILFVTAYAASTYFITYNHFTRFYDDKSGGLHYVFVKIYFQRIIYTEILAGVLILINAYEIIATNTETFSRRLIKCLLTIVITYLLGALLFKIIGKAPDFYQYRDGVPANIFFIVVVIYSAVGLTGLEIIKFFTFKFSSRENIRKLLPKWMLEAAPFLPGKAS